MKKILLTLGCLLILATAGFAAHIIGGEMRYAYVGPGMAANSKVYRITMFLFRGDASGTGIALLDPSYIVAIYNNDNSQKVRGSAANDNWVITRDVNPVPVPILVPRCIDGDTTLEYTYASYTMITPDLPDNQNGYTVVFQTCCRINGLMNVANSTGSTYSCSIPGTNQLGTGHDSSPQFGVPLNIICQNSPFVLNFSATDPDQAQRDSLVYSLCNAFNGGLSTNAQFTNPAAPPYGSANYLVSFSGSNPLGTSATIDPKTGIITGMAPEAGKYVVSVCINVYREGRLIAMHRKDLIVEVLNCTITLSNPMPDITNCGDSTIHFSHTSTGATSVFWDFGDPSSLADTSIADSPSYIFPDTGTYKAMLIINKGQNCSDTAERIIRIYPGFFPGFEVTGSCYTNPYQFTDTTKTRYGAVDSWSWNFGQDGTLADTSHLQHPVWTYPGPGPRTVTLIVTNNKGCIDTTALSIDVTDKPPLSVAFKDSLICVTDNVQLQAIGTGNFSWTPLINIVNPNTANPTVNPPTTTQYFVELNDNGCLNHDSVLVEVAHGVTMTPMAGTTICLTDSVQLHVTSNALQYEWTPATTLSDATIPNPIALPTGTTTYQVVGRIGSCVNDASITITTVPYPVARASGDTTICYNTPAQLHGFHDGSSFSWSPAGSLFNANTLNPIAYPARTTEYVLTTFDTRGCPKPGRDTILVTVLDKIIPFAGFDTTVVIFQPLQLNAEGGVAYTWTPATGLNNPNSKNPVGIYGPETDSVRYLVRVFNEKGCYDSASVKVTVFKTNPYVFVPTAFTPNGDGLNDIVKPVAAGIKRINYFRIYNRWGQLVFQTSRNGHGWDGNIRGVPQGSNVFVWTVSATDYLDKPVFLKGTLTLIR